MDTYLDDRLAYHIPHVIYVGLKRVERLFVGLELWNCFIATVDWLLQWIGIRWIITTRYAEVNEEVLWWSLGSGKEVRVSLPFRRQMGEALIPPVRK